MSVHTAFVMYGFIEDKTRLEDSSFYKLGSTQHQGEIQEIAKQVYMTMWMMMGLRSLMGGNEKQLVVIELEYIDDNALKPEFFYYFNMCNKEAGNPPIYIGVKNTREDE